MSQHSITALVWRRCLPRQYRLLCAIGVFLVVLAILPFASIEAGPDLHGQFLATSSAIRYFGRVQRGGDVLWTWPATGLRVNYNNSINVKLHFRAENFDEDPSRNTTRLVWYKIDNGPWITFPVPPNAPGSSDAVVGLQTPNDTGKHTLDVVKASEGQLTFRGIDLDPGGKLSVPTMPARRIEVVGDSISAGFRVHGGGNYESPGDHDARASYGWLLGDALGAETRLIAVTGRGVVHNFGTKPGEGRRMPDYYPFLHRETRIPNDWSWQPDVIIVNLGTNDVAPPEFTPGDMFQNAYLSFLITLRQYNPRALILALTPFGPNDGSIPVFVGEIGAAVEIRQKAGDAHTVFVNTKGWLVGGDFTDGTHPNAGGNRKAADHLIALLKARNDWAETQLPAVAAVPTFSDITPTVDLASCPGAMKTRLAIGKTARVTVDGRGPSPVLDQPGGKVIAQLAEGTLFRIFDGPRCDDASWFWIVFTPDGKAGWIRETGRGTYFIEPADT